MKQNTIEIAVKNMVCNRCIKVVRDELLKNKIDFVHVDLGNIYRSEILLEKEKELLIKILKAEGFELVEDKDSKVINQVKTVIITDIHYKKEGKPIQNLSAFLASELGMEYSNLSKLFSEIVGKTIEHYAIEQRIERAKELLIYNELTLSQISYDLNYSSPQHLSRQFKQITGMTPTLFKKKGNRKKLDTI